MTPLAAVTADVAQEYGECMADTPPGMKINFDEQNMTKWEILLDGPEQSVYAVRSRRLGSRSRASC